MISASVFLPLVVHLKVLSISLPPPPGRSQHLQPILPENHHRHHLVRSLNVCKQYYDNKERWPTMRGSKWRPYPYYDQVVYILVIYWVPQFSKFFWPTQFSNKYYYILFILSVTVTICIIIIKVQLYSIYF